MSNYDDEVLITAMKKIRDLMKRKNLPLRSPLAISACPLTRENGSVVIDQQGRIYKCNSMIGYPEFTVGHVHDETYKGRQQEFLHLDVWKKCPCDCPYLPMCGGGCRFMAFLEKKSFALPTCKRRFLDEMTPEFIKEEYDNMTNKNP